MVGIYIIKNLVNNKVYIGQSTNIERRFMDHKKLLRHNKHDNSHLQRAWNMYGEESFSFAVLQECASDELNELEIRYINEYNSTDGDCGYNNDSGGGVGRTMSEESRRKMSEAKKGMYDGDKNPMYGVHLQHSEEWKRKASERFSGEKNPMYDIHLTLTEERKQQLSEMFSGENNPFYGQNHSDETKEKMRKNNKKKKTVKCIETNTVFDSCAEACRQTGIIVNSIIKCCNGKQHTAGHYHWQYVA